MNLPQIVRWATGIRWQWKVFIPIIAMINASLIAVMALFRSLEIREFQWIVAVGVACAILPCFALLSVLLVCRTAIARIDAYHWTDPPRRPDFARFLRQTGR